MTAALPPPGAQRCPSPKLPCTHPHLRVGGLQEGALARAFATHHLHKAQELRQCEQQVADVLGALLCKVWTRAGDC